MVKFVCAREPAVLCLSLCRSSGNTLGLFFCEVSLLSGRLQMEGSCLKPDGLSLLPSDDFLRKPFCDIVHLLNMALLKFDGSVVQPPTHVGLRGVLLTTAGSLPHPL